MRACWLKWVGRDWSISADYIWLNYSDANMELRYGTASTVFCTQFKKKDWHPRLGGGVHADAIMDRIVHNAVWVDMGEANMRQRRG